MKCLSRVPSPIKAAKKLMEETDSADLISREKSGYRDQEVKSIYGGVEQRWLLVESEQRRKSDLKNLENKIHKQESERLAKIPRED